MTCVAVWKVRLHRGFSRDPLFGSSPLILLVRISVSNSLDTAKSRVFIQIIYIFEWASVGGIGRFKKWNQQRHQSISPTSCSFRTRSSAPPDPQKRFSKAILRIESLKEFVRHTGTHRPLYSLVLSGTSLFCSPAGSPPFLTRSQTAPKWQRYMTHQKQPQNSPFRIHAFIVIFKNSSDFKTSLL